MVRARTRPPTPSDPNPVPKPPRDLLVGRWITSFDLEFPEYVIAKSPWGDVRLWPLGWSHAAFLSCFDFTADFKFTARQFRNKGGKFDDKHRHGTYTLIWISGVAGGQIAIDSDGDLVLHYFVRNSNELHWVMDGSDPRIPIAQGTMYRAEILPR